MVPSSTVDHDMAWHRRASLSQSRGEGVVVVVVLVEQTLRSDGQSSRGKISPSPSDATTTLPGSRTALEA